MVLLNFATSQECFDPMSPNFVNQPKSNSHTIFSFGY